MLKKDCSLTSLIKPSIYILIGVVFLNLIMSIGNLDHSILVAWSGDVIQKTGDVSTDAINSWALRGQIGDIMSGHFSALAFFAVALGILLQIEANKQMRESIDKQDESIKQQSLALSVQSESLKEQIKELKESRKENAKQTEEFFIQNMNTKMDRYYKLLQDTYLFVIGENNIGRIHKINYKRENRLKLTQTEESLLVSTLSKTPIILKVLELIYKDIQSCKKYKESYNTLLLEYKLRIHSDLYINTICLVSYNQYHDKYSFFKIFDKKYNHVYVDLEGDNLKYIQASADL